MTVHSSKGYQCDIADLFELEAISRAAGSNQRHVGQVPDRGNVGFVGMTRARDQLVMIYTRDIPYLAHPRRRSGASSSTWPDDYEV